MSAIPGVRVTGSIVPTDTADTYPTHDSMYGLGGLRSVADHAARNAIPTARRALGMDVYTANDGVLWTLVSYPGDGSDADWDTILADRAYVNSVATGLVPKADARLATVAALPANTYANGTAGVGATLTANANGALSVDGVAVVNGNRLVIKNEVTQSHNGIYDVTASGGAGAPYVLTRSVDMDQSTEVQGAYLYAQAGTGGSNEGTGWAITSAGPYTMGTTAITFSFFGNVGAVNAGAGLSRTGNTLDVNVGTGIQITSDAVAVDFTAVQAHDTDLDALSALTTTGIIARTATGSFATRALAAGSSKVLITNGDGVVAAPTIDVQPGNFTGIPESGVTGLLTDLAAKQPLDATLTALAGVTTAADKLIYATGIDAFATTDVTAYARTLLAQASARAARLALHGQAITSVVVSSDPGADYVTDGTNDEVQFNQAYTDLSTGGYTGPRRIIAPDPTYNIQGSIIARDNVWLQGGGMFQTILAGTGGFGAIFGTSGTSAGAPLTGAGFSDFMIDGTNMDRIVYDTSHKGFYFSYTLRLRFQNVYVFNTPATGFGNDHNVDCQFDNCIAEECGANGYPGSPGYNGFGIGTGGYAEESVQWSNCIAINCGNNGFLLERQFSPDFFNNPRSYQFSNCYAIGCRSGFFITGCSGVTGTNCKAINSVSHGFLANTLSSSSPDLDIQLVACEARANGGAGFFMGDDNRFARITLEACHSNGNTGGDGFRIAGDHLKVVDCEAWLNRDAGIDIHPQGVNSSDALIVKFAPIGSLVLNGNNAWDNGQANTNGTTEGILVSGATSKIQSAEIIGNHCYDDQGSVTQKHGIHILARVQSLTVADNEAWGHGGAGINIDSGVRGPSKNLTLSNNRSFNNGRAGGTASDLVGIRVSIGTAAATLDGVTIKDNKCYDDQDTAIPDACSSGLATTAQPASGVLTGDYLYKVTFVNATGETVGGTTSPLVSPSSGQVGLVIPLGPNGVYAITARKVYRTAAGGADGTQKLLTTIANNTTATFVDNIPDGSLGASLPGSDTSGTGIVPSAPDAHIKTVLTPIAGNLTGAYWYKTTFVTAAGETAGGVTSNQTTASSNQMLLTNIPIGPPGTTARKIYRTAGGGADGTQKLLATISDNTTVTYADDIVDGSLGAAYPTTGNAFVKTQAYGLRLTGNLTGVSVNNNDLRGNLTDAVSNGIGSAARFRNNKGWNPEELYSQGNITGATTFDRTNGDTITATLTGNITPTLTNGKSVDDRLTLVLIQDATGSRTASGWSGNVKLAEGGLVLASGANKVDVVSFLWDGTFWREYSRAMATASTGGGITRNVAVIAADTAAGAVPNTDYVYFATATLTLTLPTVADAGTNRYTIKNSNTSAVLVTIAAASGEHIEGTTGGVTSITLAQYNSVDLIPSSGTGSWQII